MTKTKTKTNNEYYRFNTFEKVNEKINTKPLVAACVETAKHKHFYKGDDRLKGTDGIIQFPAITDCSAIIISTSRLVHAFHAPPGSFPDEIDKARIEGDIKSFLTEIKKINKLLQMPEEKIVDIFIIGKNIEYDRINYLQTRVSEIFNNTCIRTTHLECGNIYHTDNYILSVFDINFKKSKTRIYMMTVTYWINYDTIHVNGPSLDRKNLTYMGTNCNDIKKISQQIIPNIPKYSERGV